MSNLLSVVRRRSRPGLVIGIYGLGLVLSLWANAGTQFEAEQGRGTDRTKQPGSNLAESASRRIRVHDPSTIVPCKDEFWLFYTGPGIPSFHSKDLVNWEPGPRVFSNAPPWVAQAVPGNRRAYFWAPDVLHLAERYLAYYSVSTFGKNTSAIALATNPTLDPRDRQYRWTDRGIVVQSHSGDSFNAIDPSVILDGAGHLWLAFGSFWSGIKLVALDQATGKRLAADSAMYALASHNTIEAPCLYQHGQYFYLFVNWGTCCRGTNSTYNIRFGRSPRITGPYFDQDGLDLLQGGGSLLLGTQSDFIGPGHAGFVSAFGTNWLSCHFYDGAQSGRPTLALLPLSWTSDDWPQVDSLKKFRRRQP